MCAAKSLQLLLLVAVGCHFAAARCAQKDEEYKYKLEQELVDEIWSYQDIADKIIEFSLRGPGAGQSYNRLATFVDKFGARMSGSENLEKSIDYMMDVLKEDGMDNVHGEDVYVTNWVRNKEYARLVSPREFELSMLGLGTSVGTGGEITADVIVVSSFDELAARADEVPGKIVVYNEDYDNYFDSAVYKSTGADVASGYGAVAALIRSLTDLSINTPHTGTQEYSGEVVKIPVACITVEDAAMLARMQDRGDPIRITLYMGAENLKPAISRNTVAEVKGSLYPEELVFLGGHIDSWDVGNGALDDGGGMFVSWQAMSIMRQMGLTPKRTVRLMLWTDEENGGVGSAQYYAAHRMEADKVNIMFESDNGVFVPYGIRFHGSDKAMAILKHIALLMDSINMTTVYDADGSVTDIELWEEEGVPLSALYTHNERYFWYHHNAGDSMTVLDPVAMDLCSAAFAVYSYVLADLSIMLPRE